jgi:acetyltransferase-like isoleucine patch superfamily enzyme
MAMRIAAWPVTPHKGRIFLSEISTKGYIESTAIVHHPRLHPGRHCFLGDRVVIFERKGGGDITLGDHVQINRDSVLETGLGGAITLGHHASLHPGCHLYAYLAPIEIGDGVMLAPNCAIYSYDHSLDPGVPIRFQPPKTKGRIVIGEEAWLGFGTIVLSGVTIGKGAVIGAGSVVVNDIPDNAIAIGNPARVVKKRDSCER